MTYEWLNGCEVNNGVCINTLTEIGAKNASKEWAASWVNTDYFPLAFHFSNFNFVRNDESTAYQVNKVTRKKVFSEK